MRSLRKIFEKSGEKPSRDNTGIEIIHPPKTEAERAEERIFEEAKKKDKIISDYRRGIGDKK